MRAPNSRAMASRSLSALAPKEPTQNVSPFASVSQAPRIALTSSAVETTRGRPNSDHGGSSGCMARRTPTCCATGTTSRRNATRLLRNSAARYAVIFSNQTANRLAIVRRLGAGESRDDCLLQIIAGALAAWTGSDCALHERALRSSRPRRLCARE